MSSRKIFLLLTVLLLLPVAPTVAFTSVGFAFDFHSALAPYGGWVHVPGYGDCWRPYAGAGFMPFTNGYFEYTSYGPTWVGYEPWAWAAYHYGHWAFTPAFGWFWVPGYVWEPAPVEWAIGPGFIGWSPFFGAPFFSFNFFVFAHDRDFFFFDRDDFFDHDHFRSLQKQFDDRLILGRDARATLNRASFVIQKDPLTRNQIQRIARRPLRPMPVVQRTVRIGQHTSRMVIPQNNRANVMQQLTRASTRASTSRASGTRASMRRPNGARRFSTARDRFVDRSGRTAISHRARRGFGMTRQDQRESLRAQQRERERFERAPARMAPPRRMAPPPRMRMPAGRAGARPAQRPARVRG